MFEFAEEVQRLTDIRVAGVGGAGGNAVNRMITSGLSGVEFLALNTDLQALEDSRAHHNMQIGAELTQGLGSGGNPVVGEGAAEEDRDSIRKALGDANLVFVTAGMGGGTGTGAAPVVAEIARKQGALTVGIVTKPFLFEGRVRMAQAEEGIARLRKVVDTLIVVPNQRLLEIVPPNTSMDEAFLIADQVLYEATRGIFDIISRHDTLNLDFADVRSVMEGMGVALMGTGRASGENRAMEAAKAAINSPLLENLNIFGSKAVLVNVLGGQVGLHDTAEAMNFVQEAAGPDAHVIFGYGIDESLGDILQVTVIATGFDAEQDMGGTVSLAAAPTVVQPSENHEAEKPVIPVESEVVAELPTEIEMPVSGEASVELASPVELESVLENEQVVGEVAINEGESPSEIIETVLEPASEAPELVETVSPVCEPEPEPEPEPDIVQVRNTEVAINAVNDQTQTEEPKTPVFEDPRHLDLKEEISAEQPAFLQRAASAGGKVSTVDSSVANTRFLRPVGRRNIGEVEVPETDKGPVPISRSTASGLGPDKPGEDRATPAYIRKYMD